MLLLTVLAAAGPAAAAPDATPPAVKIMDPVNGAALKGTVTVQGTAQSTSESRRVELVEVQVDSGGWRAASGTTIWSYRLDTVPLEDGWHTLRARSFDGTEFSEPAGIEFESRNAGSASESLGFAICIVLFVALVIGLLGVFLYYYSKSSQAGSAPAASSTPAVQSYPPQLWYTDQTGRRSPYPFPGSPYYPPRPPPAGVPHSAVPPRIHSPGSGQGAGDAIEVAPEYGGAIPPQPVVEHEGAAVGVSGGLEIDETMSLDAEAGERMVPDVIEVGEDLPPETVELVDMGAGASPEQLSAGWPAPEGPFAPASVLSGGDRHARVKRALMTMPRGLPLPLLGVTMDELAGLILRAPRQNAPGGSPVVRLKGRWYRADENNLKDFMVEYKT